jgi:predicted transcriptional regulator
MKSILVLAGLLLPLGSSLVDAADRRKDELPPKNMTDSQLKTVTQSVEPGRYIDFDVSGPFSGLQRKDASIIGPIDDPAAFALPEHVEANQLWFSSGYLTWAFLVNIPGNSEIESVSYTAEISSECPGACDVWPSPLTVNLNGVDIDTFTIPGDPDTGWLATWTVTKSGTFMTFILPENRSYHDEQPMKVSDVTVEELNVRPGDDLLVKLSVELTPSGGGLTVYGKGNPGATGTFPGFAGSFYPGNAPTIRVNFHSPDSDRTYAADR